MKIITITLVFLLFAISAHSQSLSNEQAESFIQALLNNSEELNGFYDPAELKLSDRLGISYSEIKFKLLISNDIDKQIKSRILKNQLDYDFDITPLAKNFSKLVINIPKNKRKYEYIFYKAKLISKPSYYSRTWNRLSSKYFIFHTNNLALLNDYSINKLDTFVESMLDFLQCSENEKQILQDAKIHYFLCQNDSEIKNLTGYTARGLYYIPNDYIISTFNCHYHELCHLLINYKLKSLKLFTQPLFQEGFAVAFGGRGGKESNVILNMGLFLEKSNFVNYKMLLSKKEFSQLDASMTYPVAGLYTKFLIKSIGLKKYLDLYQKFSYSYYEEDLIPISPDDLPSSLEWDKYLNEQTDLNPIKISNIDVTDFPFTVMENDDIFIYANDAVYLIKIRNSVGLKSKSIKNYQSKLFSELFPNSHYNSEKYIVSANNDEVSIYNLYTNNLIAKYVRGFSIDNKPVKQEGGYFIFTVEKEIFDDDLENLIIEKSGS